MSEVRTQLTPTRRAIVVMGRLPLPGKVKTRLAARFGPEAAARLYAAFLEDVLVLVEALAEAIQAEALFCCALDGAPLTEAAALCPPGVRAIPQGDGDLGARMEQARRDAGAPHVVIVGSDAPTMPRERIFQAFTKLDAGAAAVFGPTVDGGYDLVGLPGPAGRLFRGIPWSTDLVMSATRATALQVGLHIEELGVGYDLDEPEDLERALLDSQDGRAPRTRAAIRAVLGR